MMVNIGLLVIIVEWDSMAVVSATIWCWGQFNQYKLDHWLRQLYVYMIIHS